jgi:Chitin binding Peritrophin-A domain/Trypsin Inhibitor like cysteine rich domain
MLKSECRPTDPYTDYPGDCNKFRQCMQMLDGSYKYTIKICGANMFYNPVSKVCDWPTSVIQLKPECDEANNKQDPATGNLVNIKRNCPPGLVWSACAAPCGRACDYYAKVLKQSGDCVNQFDECKAGCIPDTFAVDCPAGKVWRDGKTCVNVLDCTCMSNDGTMVKPNIPYQESECKKCQCVDNSYVCMDLPCAKPTESPILGLKIPTTPSKLLLA